MRTADVPKEQKNLGKVFLVKTVSATTKEITSWIISDASVDINANGKVRLTLRVV